METGSENFDKDKLALNFDKNESILANPNKVYFKAVKYNQNNEYAKYINEQKKIKLNLPKSTLGLLLNDFKPTPRHKSTPRNKPTLRNKPELNFSKYLKYKIKYLKLKNKISSANL